LQRIRHPAALSLLLLPAEPRRPLWHLAWADLNVELAVLIPVVLNTGPLPEVLGVGRLTPFSRMQATNFVSAALDVELLNRPPPPKLPPPHFFSASWNCVLLTPLGGWNPPGRPSPPPCPVVPEPAGGRFPDGAGSVIPCFARQDLNAVNRLNPDAPVDDVPALVDVVFVELLAELPHAASARQAPSTDSTRIGRKRRAVVGLETRWGYMGFFPLLMFV
jgi:hypothetical protein